MPGFPLIQIGRATAGPGSLAPAPPTVGSTGWVVIPKTADENRNSSAQAIDSQLQINVAAGQRYRLRGLLFMTCSANGVSVAVTFVGTATMTLFLAQHYSVSNTSAEGITSPTLWTPTPHTAYPAIRAVAVSGGEYVTYEIDCIAVPATSGTLGISWAQSVNNAGQTATMARGSVLEYQRF